MAVSTLHKLNAVESFRAQVLLEDTLKKLDFLASVSSKQAGAQNELIQFMGDEVSRIINEQAQFQKQYEVLINERSDLKGLCNKKQFLQIQNKIQELCHRLRESNKQLCRNLKENPNVPGNILKMGLERQRIQTWLEETKLELLDLTFIETVSKVEEERKVQGQLDEYKRKEAEATQGVKELEESLSREIRENETALFSMETEIKELKDTLSRKRKVADIELAFEEKRLKAQCAAEHREWVRKLLVTEKEYDNLLNIHKENLYVNQVTCQHFTDKIEILNNDKARWQEKSDYEKRELERILNSLREERGHAIEEFTGLKNRKETFDREAEKEKQNQKNKVYIDYQKNLMEGRVENAIIDLQSKGRVYIQKMKEEHEKRKGMKGKKGKKDKKK